MLLYDKTTNRSCMPLSDSDFNEHVAPVLNDGSELNPQEFKHLAGWNYILMQTAMADHYLKHLRSHQTQLDPSRPSLTATGREPGSAVIPRTCCSSGKCSTIAAIA